MADSVQCTANQNLFIFTTLGARGAYGPTSTAGYQGTSLEDQVILNKGIQRWTVPVTGSYVIEAAGASGASGANGTKLGGLGAKMTGTFQINEGTKLKILVGQEGCTNAEHLIPGGGGGGSFVTLSDDTPLIVAGGGGGGGEEGNFTNGDPGQATRNGSQCGGTQGGGGKACNASTGEEEFFLLSGGGAGMHGNGSSWLKIYHERDALAPRSFITGGTGGQDLSDNWSSGGFGGGSVAFLYSGGGGGGYSGGGVVSTYEKEPQGEGGHIMWERINRTWLEPIRAMVK
ncbi:PREDICTED: ALK tyrosine kinase receptor-like [Acropora digitifera]|uniref:ALK tyrosine kinase receptor-like n=1 Tax=Acropora digitifera TaxID=70779 RepID=UPI00077A4CF1|nr:PREDICTED: ALK tyrosine kinase receptor-like [Acropora digitifera]